MSASGAERLEMEKAICYKSVYSRPVVINIEKISSEKGGRTMYSEVVMDHFRKPRNVGVIKDANGVGEVGNPLCGDMMTIYLKIKD